MIKLLRFVALLSLLAYPAQGALAETTIYLVRHAEKASDGTRDPNLTVKGQARAKWLAGYFKDKGIVEVYSTNYKRTRQTAAPTAKALGLSVTLYDPRALSAFADQIRNTQVPSLIVGHSNTSPMLVNLLTGENWPELEEYQYDHVYRVILQKDGTASASVSYSDPRTNPYPAIAAFKRAIVNRLAVMEDVARYKWNNGLPVEASEREAAVIEATARQAELAGLNTGLATHIITAQMEASKALQRQLFDQWQKQGIAKFDNVPSLPDDIRPRIDHLTQQLIAAAVHANTAWNNCEARKFLKHPPVAFYDNESVWQAAIHKLDADLPACP